MKTNSSFIIFPVDIEDIIQVGDCLFDINAIKISPMFKIKDLRQFKYFLELEIARSYKCLHVC